MIRLTSRFPAERKELPPGSRCARAEYLLPFFSLQPTYENNPKACPYPRRGRPLRGGLAHVCSLDSSQVAFLPVDPAFGWSDTTFTSLPVKDFPFGRAQVTVFTNGIPSTAKPVIVAKRHD
jgi:hypothetical protein